MIACPGCGFEAPDDSAFCSKCGTRLVAPQAIPEERKVVTTLICDLVGFTAMSEDADPEDVDRLLGEYSSRARKVIESHGGTVEKYIGDAVVGIFGVPAVHEHDPERAVRAGLRLVEALEGVSRPDGSPLQVRIGVNTGEALVRLDVDPASGRGFLTGDAVNTAARLQAAAPPSGVAVGVLTHKLTARVIDYQELPPVAAKGKAEPLAAWRAIAPVSRRGLDTDAGGLTPFMGREVELADLFAIFDKAATQSLPQFALIIGEPGIGKSRLVRQLFAGVDSRPAMTTWRQGYCPPFGEDVTYWALAEVVKGHAGIRDTDGTAAVEAKLEAVLPSGPDREWFRQRLRALVGLPAPEAPREQNFAAWLRFFEGLAVSEPTVLVLEDLHWADPALLAFLEYLTTHLADVPLLVLGTARPELFERQPGLATVASTRIDLGPLSPSETAYLVARLLGESNERAKAVEQVVERCDGNPFFAEQLVRLLADTGPEAPLPDSVQAVIAARLDSLPADQKTLLGDAAVLGAVFWDGAVAAVGAHEPGHVQSVLSALVERRLVRRIHESSMEGEREFAFMHALARDVVYAELPRPARAEKHTAAAQWYERKTEGHIEDAAEVLAHHYSTALELAQSASRIDLASRAMNPARRFLSLAGGRALNVDLAAAESYFARALRITPDGSEERPELLVAWASSLEQRGRLPEAAAACKEAIDSLETSERTVAKAAVLSQLSSVLVSLGGPGALDCALDAVALVEDRGPSRELALALVRAAFASAVNGDDDAALHFVDRAVQTTDALGLSPMVDALRMRGAQRCMRGDERGRDDARRALSEAKAQGLGLELCRTFVTESIVEAAFLGPTVAVKYAREGLEVARRRSIEAAVHDCCGALVEAQYLMGQWDEALAVAEEVTPAVAATHDEINLPEIQLAQVMMHACRGDIREASTIAAAFGFEDQPDPFHYRLPAAITIAFHLRQHGRAVEGLKRWAEVPQQGSDLIAVTFAVEAVRMALGEAQTDLAQRLAQRFVPILPVQQHTRAACHALLLESRNEDLDAVSGFADAASRWHDFGVPYEEAQALVGQGRCLIALGRAPEASGPIVAARDIFTRLGARPALAEAEELTQQVASAQ